LLTPLDSLTTTLSWTAHPDAILYRVVLVRQNQMVLRIRVNPSQCINRICTLDLSMHPQTNPLNSGVRYRWSVVAITPSGRLESEAVRIRYFAPSPVTASLNLIAPVNGAVVPELPTFEWQAVAGATSYRVLFERDGVFYGEYDFNAAFCTPTLCRLEVLNHPFVPPFELVYTYTWSIVTQTPQGMITSPQRSFTIENPHLIVDPSVYNEINPTQGQGSTPISSIVYSTINGLRVLNPALPNTDPNFDRIILYRNGQTVLGGFGYINSPVWRPNTQIIAFAGGTSVYQSINPIVLTTITYDIFLTDANGSNPQRWLSTPENETHVAWSYDRSRIAAQSYVSSTGLFQIKIYDYATTTLITTLSNAKNPMWHHDSNSIAYIDSTNKVLRYHLNTQTPTVLVEPTFIAPVSMDWYTDNGRNELVYHNEYGIWKRNLAHSNAAIQLTRSKHAINNPNGLYTDSYPVWSPDGTKILINRFTSGIGVEMGTILADGTNFTRIRQENPYYLKDWAYNQTSHTLPTPMPTPGRPLVYNIKFSNDLGERDPNWSTDEINQINQAVTRVGQAFQLMLNTSSPEEAFNRVMTQGADPQYVYFFRGPGTTNTYEIIYPPELEKDNFPTTVNIGGCLTINNNALPRTITCNWSPTVRAAYPVHAMVHELGHVFTNRSINDNAPVDSVERTLGLLYAAVDGTYSGTCSVTFANTNVPDPFAGMIFNQSRCERVNDANGQIVMGILQGGEWARGKRGWGSGPDTIFSPFQQHPPGEFPEDDSITLVDETAADMFLNWVYRKTSPNAGISNPCTVPGTWDGFRNTSWVGDITTGNNDVTCPGDARFEWMERVINRIFTVKGW
jgi:Tol biopolymer transport system component